MTAIPFNALLGPSYTMFSPKAEVELSINCFRQRVQTDEGIGPFVLLRSPGLKIISQPSGGAGTFRGGFELNDNVFVIIDGEGYIFDSGFSVFRTYPGISNNTGAPVRIASSPTAIMFVSDAILYRAGTTLTTPTITFTPQDVQYLDTYFVAEDTDGGFYFSSDDGVTWNPADFQSAEASANNTIAGIVHLETLYIYGNRITQAFVVGSNPNAPFQKQTSGVIPFGLNAYASLQSIGNYRYWLGRNKEGQGIVYRGTGYGVQRISNLALENAIRTYQRDFGTDDAIGMVYQQNGQEFYRLTFPAADASWELNCTITDETNQPEWEQVAGWDYVNGQYHRHRANMIVSAFGKILVGDYQNGWLYEMTPDEYTDAGYPQRGNRRTPHILQSNHNVIYDELEVGAQTGVGLTSPLWLQTFSMDRATFVTALATQVSDGNVTADQAIVLQEIYDLAPYTPLNPYPSPDTMNTLGFTPWGAPAVLNDNTVLGGPPTLEMAYSNDGAKSFSAYLERSLGNAGEDVRVIWDRGGMGRDRVFDLVWDHPCKMAITTSWIDAEELAS